MSGAVPRGLLLGSVAGISGLGIGAPGVVLPDVADAFGIAEDATAWVLAAFVLGTGAAMTVGGRALDVLGPRRVVLAGAIAVALGTLVMLLDASYAVLVAGRFVQGAGSGWLTITAFSAVSHVAAADRARVGGILTALSFSCIAASPLVGALVAEAAGWRGALVIAVFTLLPARSILHGLPSEPSSSARLDVRGAALASVGAVAIAAILQGPATDTPLWLNAVLAAVAVAALAALAHHLRRTADGFLPLRVLRNRELVELSLSAATIQAAYTGLIFAAPLILAREAGWSALETGAALAPGALIGATSAHLAGTAGAARPAATMLVGLCAVSTTGALATGLGADLAVVVVAGALVTIAPYAAVQAIMLGRIATLVAADDIGAATGTFSYIFITGGTVGAAAVGGLASITGLGAAVALLAILPAVGLAVALRLRAPAPAPAAAA